MRGPLLMLVSGYDKISVILSFFSVFVIIFLCFPIHECAHAVAAKFCGDDTAEREGRITLNPFAHIDLRGALMILLFGIGYARPTPVSLIKCRKFSMRKSGALIAAAGPISNLLMAFLFHIIGRLVLVFAPATDAAYYVYLGVISIVQINIWLAVFNFLPVPGFDGYRIVESFLPNKVVNWIERHAGIISLVMIVILFSGLLSFPLQAVSNAVMWVFDFLTMWIG